MTKWGTASRQLIRQCVPGGPRREEAVWFEMCGESFTCETFCLLVCLFVLYVVHLCVFFFFSEMCFLLLTL